MGKQFRDVIGFDVDASPETVWQAVATGPGVSSWYIGRTEVDADTVSSSCGPYQPVASVLAREEPHRFAYSDGPDEEGRFVAFEFLVEGREGGSTSVRMVASGFLPGDDWADEYEAMTLGGALYSATLQAYLRHLAPRTGRPFSAWGPLVGDWDAARARLVELLGGEEGRVSLEVDGVPPIKGTVYHANSHTIGVVAPDGIYRFLKAFQGGVMVSHVLFDPEADVPAAERAWSAWLTRVFG